MNNLYDLIIIGGGPAGITAGIYAGRQKMKTLLITKEFGGQISKKAVDIENWPGEISISGFDLVNKFVNHLKEQDIEIKMDKVGKIEKENDIFKVLVSSGGEFFSKSVIIATGADPRPLEVPGEKEFIGRGVSYCATCDGPMFKDKTIAIIGGGNSGFEVAIFMLNYAEKIYIIHSREEVKADKENQEAVINSGKVDIIKNVSVKKINGNKFVEELVYENKETNKEEVIKLDGIFVSIGHQPATSFVRDLVNFTEKDEIEVAYETMQTKTPGLFAVGDINVGAYRQIVTAAGEGCKATLSAYKYLRSLQKK